MEQHPVQCRNGCGFYGNQASEGYCSVCYKDIIKKKQQPPTNMPASLTPAPGSMATLSIDESSSSSPMKAQQSSTSSIHDTASPTVILPSQTDKRILGGQSTSGESEPTPIGAIAIPGSSAATSDLLTGSSPSTPNGSEADESGLKEGKKKKNRCMSCKKKVGLTGFECRCGGLFCSIHRYSDKHECNFDYKELGAEEIRKSNPVVVANKIQKI